MTLRRVTALRHDWPLNCTLAVVRNFCGVWSETAPKIAVNAMKHRRGLVRDAKAIS